MGTFVLILIAIVIVAVFWRVLLPVALLGVGAVVVIGMLLYWNGQSEEREREMQRAAAQAEIAKVRKRMRESEGTPENYWRVRTDEDPASGESVPRFAYVYSNDGLFLLQVESRLNGTKLIAFYSQREAVNFARYGYGETLTIKFDGWDTSRRAEVNRFNNGDDIFISESGSSYAYRSTVDFGTLIQSLAGQNTLAIHAKLENLGQEWITFPLTGSRTALVEIGMISAPAPSDPSSRQSSPESTAPTRISPSTLTELPDSKVVIPDNAYVSGNRWYCSSGYKRIGNDCIALDVPSNAYISGNRWYCNSGYQRMGNDCVELDVPKNAYVSGNRWYCNSGYRRVRSGCVALKVPANAYVSGNRWYCNSGFQRIGDRCGKLKVPDNAYVSGNRWYCNSGYQRVANTCIAMVKN